MLDMTRLALCRLHDRTRQASHTPDPGGDRRDRGGGGGGGSRGDDDYSSGFSTGGANKPSGPKESYDLNDDIPF